VRLGNLLERVAPINDRFECSRLPQLREETQVLKINSPAHRNNLTANPASPFAEGRGSLVCSLALRIPIKKKQVAGNLKVGQKK
jgi:hypothetical protein